MSKILNIDEVQGNFYGGMPYSVSWEFNGGENASSLKVSVVNESGEYGDIGRDLNFTNIVTITLGSFKFKGYLVSYDIEETPEHRILNLQYLDQSSDLSRYYVGLHTRHGDKSADNIATNLILLGKEYHPCDNNFDSTVSYEELENPTVEPCDPCPSMPTDKYKLACSPKLADYQIFEVYYTFNELVDYLNSLFTCNLPDEVNNTFRAQHTGPLKSVLSAWCADLGLSFFWDPFYNTLNFIDRSSPLSIPSISDIRSYGNVMDLKYGESKTNTFSRGYLGYFAKAGEKKSYTCKYDDSLSFQVLTPLHLADLFETPGGSSAQAEAKRAYILALEKVVLCTHLGKSVRDFYIWFIIHGLNKASTAATLNNQNKLAYIAEFSMQLLYVMSATVNSGDFNRCERVVTPSEIQSLKEQDKNAKRDPTKNPSYYFFVAEVDDIAADETYQRHQNLANSFLGKHFYKKYSIPIIGNSNTPPSVQVESPDGGTYYLAKQEISNLEFFKFGHEPGSTIGVLQNSLAKDAEKNSKLTPDANKIIAATSFLYVNRNAQWSPDGEALAECQTAFNKYESYCPKLVGDGRPEILFDMWPDAKYNYNIKLFIGRENVEGLSVNFGKGNNPYDAPYPQPKYKSQEDINGEPINTYVGSYGLTNNVCSTVTLNGVYTVYAPSVALSENGGAYTIFAQPSAPYDKIIPKTQFTQALMPESSDVAHLDYNFREIQEDNIRAISASNCIATPEQINAYMRVISKNSAYTMKESQKTASFKLAGVLPKVISVADGLNSLQINLSDKGVYTSYSLEDKVIVPPSDQYVLQNILHRMKSKNAGGYNFVSKDVQDLVTVGL